MPQVELDCTGLSVMLMMPVHRDLPWQTVKSLIETHSLMQARGIPFNIQMQVGGSIIEAARSKGAYHFLKSDCNRLFWVDSDIEWGANDFLRLVAISSKLDVVGASYPFKREPTQFAMATGELNGSESNELGCIPVTGFGMGFTVVSRAVIEELSKRSPVVRFPDVDEPIPHIFHCDISRGDFRGEDVAFFADIRALGITVYLDPTIALGHVGSKSYRGRIGDHLIPVQPETPTKDLN